MYLGIVLINLRAFTLQTETEIIKDLRTSVPRHTLTPSFLFLFGHLYWTVLIGRHKRTVQSLKTGSGEPRSFLVWRFVGSTVQSEETLTLIGTGVELCPFYLHSSFVTSYLGTND